MRLIRVQEDERAWFAGLLAFALAQSAAALLTAWTVKQLFDKFDRKHHQVSWSVGTLVCVFVAMAVAAAAMDAFKRRAAAEISLRRAASIRLALFRHLTSHPQIAVGRNKGGLLLPFVGDLTAIRRWAGDGLPSAASALVLASVVLVAVSLKDAFMGCLLSLVLAVSFACSVLLVPALDRSVRDVRRRRGALTSFIIGRVDAAATIHTSGRGRAEAQKVQRRIDALSAAERWRAWVMGATGGVGSMTRGALILCTVVTGFYETRAGRTTAGGVAATLTLVHLLSSGVTDLVRAFEAYRPAKVAFERVERILMMSGNERSRSGSSNAPRIASAGLLLRDLSILPQVQEVNAEALPGEVILVEGPPGSGRSALLRAIAGLAPISKGTILYDQVDLAHERASARAKLIGYAASDLPLLPGSLGMNLRYRAKASERELRILARYCGLGQLIDRLPDGLESRLTGRFDLSVGERHGIALARAIAGRPPLLLLDAIDAHLVPEAIAWLRERLLNYSGVVLMTATAASLREAANLKWQFDAGHLINIERLDRLSSPSTVVPIRQPK